MSMARFSPGDGGVGAELGADTGGFAGGLRLESTSGPRLFESCSECSNKVRTLAVAAGAEGGAVPAAVLAGVEAGVARSALAVGLVSVTPVFAARSGARRTAR